MRKLIVVFLIAVIVLCGTILYGPAISLVPEWQKVTNKEIPTSLQEDIALVREDDGGEVSVTVEFSHDEFFYDEDIAVEILSNNPSAKIYYTTDSSTPTRDSIQYTKAITMSASETEQCVVLKAIAIDDKEQSEVLTHSYFLGRDINKRFVTNYVFSLSTDDEHLHDYETGILVAGKIYDDYMAENPETEIKEWHRPANYHGRGREWEKPVHVEAFNQEGKRVIAQNVGLRVNGRATRYFSQKSLRLIARKEYEPTEGKFKYPFFKELTTADTYEIPIVSYDTLVLRNDGNDWDLGRLRTPLASLISKEAGFDVVTPYATSAVFVNGIYYGYAVLNVNINEQFLEDLYEAPERSFDIVEGGSTKVATEDKDIANEFNELLKCAETGDIKELEKNFDIDNLLLYYAIGVYVSNSDWPSNNVRIWRYTGSAEHDNRAKELDGRWRFILYDLDQTMNRNERSAPDFKSLQRLINHASDDPEVIRDSQSPIFATLLTRPEYAEQFVNNICDLAYEHFSRDNMQKTIKAMDEVSLEEIKISNEYYAMPIENLVESRDNLVSFAEQRPDYILEEVKEFFGYSDMYQIKSDGSCKINTLNGNEGKYFVESHVPITPTPDKGEEFDYWLINGEKRTGENLLVSVKDVDSSGVVNIKAVYRQKQSPLIFEDTYDDGEMFGFTICNTSDTIQSTRGLYLSDNVNELQKWEFPDLNIGANIKWDFVGKNVTAYDSLLKIKLNFNPREGEMIFLSDDKGEVLDYILMEP